eukprot:SAG11_NODE_8548_length_1002_cov_1.289037_2_plen_83_part_00
MISALVNAGADVNGLHDGKTQLRIAAAAGQMEVVAALLHAQADSNAKNDDEQTPLAAAAGAGERCAWFGPVKTQNIVCARPP